MAYAVLKRKRRLMNPGKRRKKLSAKQIRFFGTKRQRAALKARRHTNTSIRHQARLRITHGPAGRSTHPSYLRKKYKGKAKAARRAKRQSNVGSILVAKIPGLMGMNPGKKRRTNKGMTKAARRRAGKKAARTRARRKAARSGARRHYKRNPGSRRHSRTRTVVKYRYRAKHQNRGRRRRHNPGGLSMGLGADVNIVGGILAGVAFTRLASGFVPASLATGIPGYITTALIAMLPRFISKKPFTKYMSWGGLAVLGGKIINDYAPSFAGYIPGFNGLGFVAANGGFFTPQLPQFGSMGRFVAPGTVSAAIAAAAGKGGIHGLQIAPSTRGSIGDGNFGARRGGRLN